MTAEALQSILRRAQDEPTFLARLEHDSDAALHGYDLTVAERAALIAGDDAKLRQLGVPEELSLFAARANRDGDDKRQPPVS